MFSSLFAIDFCFLEFVFQKTIFLSMLDQKQDEKLRWPCAEGLLDLYFNRSFKRLVMHFCVLLIKNLIA